MKAKDLAKLLGVSPATISLVLNNKPGISDSLRKELLQKIEQLGCESMMCSSCREGRAPGETAPEWGGKTIAYLNYQDGDALGDYFFPGVLEGAEVEARDNGYAFSLLHRACHNELSLQELFNKIGNVVGAVVQCAYLTDRVREDIASIDLPFVFIDLCTDDPKVNSVRINNWQGIPELAKMLARKGHEKIGYVYSSEENVEWRQDRRVSFQCSMRDLGLDDNVERLYCVADVPGDPYDYSQLTELFSAETELPTALICENDPMAVRVMNALHELGLRIPEDVSVTGFDDIPISKMTSPRLTTVRNSSQFMGRECIIMLQNLLRLRELGLPHERLEYLLPAEIVERDSVKDLTKDL